jgi:hypothetical protein
MLVACRLAGLSALEAYYAALIALTQSGAGACGVGYAPHAPGRGMTGSATGN